MKSICLLSIIFFTYQLNAQSFEWAAQMGGIGIEEPSDILIDETDNSIYLVGFFYGDFDPDPAGSTAVSSIDAGDAIIVKLDANGNLQWANQIGGLDNEYATKIAIDNQQNVYLLVNASPKVNLYKFNGSNGNAMWFYSSDYTTQANGYGLTLDASNNVYISGTYSDSVDFDNSNNTNYLISEGNEDGFVLKIDPSGNYIWAKSFGNIFGGALFRDIEWHINNQLYISGYFYGQVDFDPSSSISYLNAIASTDAFVLRLDTAGSFNWVKQTGGTDAVRCNALTIDDNGDLIMAGDYMGTISLDPNGSTADYTEEGGGDFYVQKLDTNGNLIWATSIGGTAYDLAEGIDTDPAGNIYVTGKFADVVDFDPSSTQDLLNAGFASDAFILKLSENGDYNWALPVVGETGFNNGKDVSIDANNKLIFTGTFSDSTDLDPTIYNSYYSTDDPMDWFVIKLNLSETASIAETEHTFAVFPNPSNGQITIDSPISGKLNIYNLNGQRTKSIQLAKGKQQLSLHLQSGMYLLEITNTEKTYHQKLQLY